MPDADGKSAAHVRIDYTVAREAALALSAAAHQSLQNGDWGQARIQADALTHLLEALAI
jgi:hypothetical protein